YFEDMISAGDCCRQIVESSGVHFDDFRLKVLSKILDADDFASEGAILQKVWERFSTLDDRVAALERMCFIYEKKVHNDKLLSLFYERLIKTYPQNQKALRYFRTINTQMQDWPAVVDVLKRLLRYARHPQEGFRHAQELAAVYLYQLDDPITSVQIIEEHCSNSTLDTSTIHYEAYFRMGKHEGCLRVLRSCLASIEEPLTRAIVHYRMGSLLEKIGELNFAVENYERAIQLDENFLEAIEGLISASLKMRRWSSVKDWLSVLASRVTSSSLASQVRA
ncbi:MAG: tetratricopeptide repeat protein, partial [Proteobacteria bacterium]|nr:tetratricopeptide repeat protein [Pseudomonadota bacterium]